MSGGFWHVRRDFDTASPSELVEQYWTDDELNRQRSIGTFKDELALVDEGLTIYMKAIQGALKVRDGWKENVRLRASIAMLIHALNSFLAWRHLLTLGYLAEARLFSRSIHESLSQALAFVDDETLAKKFYEGRQIQAKEIRLRLSSTLANEETGKEEVLKQLSEMYKRLSAVAHPTLNSFSLRTAAHQPGNLGLRKSVPEDVVMGGLLHDDIGRVAWLSLARDIGSALASVGFVLRDATGAWDRQYQEYGAIVDKQWQSSDPRPV